MAMGGNRVIAGRAVIEVQAQANVRAGMRQVQQQVQEGLSGSRMSAMTIAAGTAMGNLFASAITKGFSMLVGMGKGVADYFNRSVSAASHFIETTNKMEVAFGDQTQAVEDWAKTYANSVGRSIQQTRDMVAKMKLLADSFDIASEAGTSMARVSTMLAHDIGSLMDVADDEAMRAVQSALVGQVESMKRIGMAAPMQGQVNSFLESLGIDPEEATEAQKMQARLVLILDATEKAAGDAAKTMNTYANILKRITAVKDNLLVTIGQKLLPIWEAWKGAVLSAYSDFENYVSQFENLGDLIVDIGERMGSSWSESVSLISEKFETLRNLMMSGELGKAVEYIGLLFSRMWLSVEQGFTEMITKIASEMSWLGRKVHGLEGFAEGSDEVRNRRELMANEMFAKDRAIAVAQEEAAKAWERTQQSAADVAEGIKDDYKTERDRILDDLKAGVGGEGGKGSAKSLPPLGAMKPYNMQNAEDFMHVMGLKTQGQTTAEMLQKEDVELSKSQLRELEAQRSIAEEQFQFFKSGAFSGGGVANASDT